MDFKKMMYQEGKTKKRNHPRRKKRSQSSPIPRAIPGTTQVPPSNPMLQIRTQRITDWATNSTVARPPTWYVVEDPSKNLTGMTD